MPEEIEFTQRGAYVGRNSLKVYDFFLFAQDVFANWVGAMRVMRAIAAFAPAAR